VRGLRGRFWVVAHNGDLKGFSPQLHVAFRLVGDTDSELAFCWLMQELDRAHASVPSIRGLTATLRELAPQAAACGTFNFMLSNGQSLWAHCSTQLHSLQRRAPFGSAPAGREPARRFRRFDQAGRPRCGGRHRTADAR
jgi:predicted glutamine amidotransferase